MSRILQLMEPFTVVPQEIMPTCYIYVGHANIKLSRLLARPKNPTH